MKNPTKYDCSGFIVCNISENPECLEPCKIVLPENYSEILDAKQRMKMRIKKCSCGQTAYSREVKIKTGQRYSKGYVEYLDYSITRDICDKCFEMYRKYEMIIQRNAAS